MKSPKKPKESAEERALRARQVRALDKTQEKENRMRKMIAFGRLGTRQLLSGGATGILDERASRAGIGGTRPGRGAGSGPAGGGGREPIAGGGGGGGGSVGDLRLR